MSQQHAQHPHLTLSDHCVVDHTQKLPDAEEQIPFGPKLPFLLGMFAIDRVMHFTGVRGALWRVLGVDRSPKNPNVCNV